MEIKNTARLTEFASLLEDLASDELYICTECKSLFSEYDLCGESACPECLGDFECIYFEDFFNEFVSDNDVHPILGGGFRCDNSYRFTIELANGDVFIVDTGLQMILSGGMREFATITLNTADRINSEMRRYY